MTWENKINEGCIALLCHDYNLAEEHFHQALLLLSNTQSARQDFLARTLALLGEALFLQKKYFEAAQFLEQAEQNFSMLFSSDDYCQGVVYYCLAEILLWQGNDNDAEQCFLAAVPFLMTLHPSHRYRRRTAEFLDSRDDDYIGILNEPNNPELDFCPAGTSEVVGSTEQYQDAMNWLTHAKASLQKETLEGRLEAYVAINRALALSTWCASIISPSSEVVLSMLAEIAIVVRGDELAAKLCHASLQLNISLYGESSIGAAKAQGLLATQYAQQCQLEIAEEIFRSAFETLEKIGESIELIMPEELKIYEQLKIYRASLAKADALIKEADVCFDGRRLRARKCLEKARRELACFPTNSRVFLPVQRCLVRVCEQMQNKNLLNKAQEQLVLLEQTELQRQIDKQEINKQLPDLARWTDEAA